MISKVDFLVAEMLRVYEPFRVNSPEYHGGNVLGLEIHHFIRDACAALKWTDDNDIKFCDEVGSRLGLAAGFVSIANSKRSHLVMNVQSRELSMETLIMRLVPLYRKEKIKTIEGNSSSI